MRARSTGPKAIERQMRISRILDMRIVGKSMKEIGQAEDPPCSAQAICQLLQRALVEMPMEGVAEARSLELMRCDQMLKGGLFQRAVDATSRQSTECSRSCGAEARC
jgi:hypothetical protein